MSASGETVHSITVGTLRLSQNGLFFAFLTQLRSTRFPKQAGCPPAHTWPTASADSRTYHDLIKLFGQLQALDDRYALTSLHSCRGCSLPHSTCVSRPQQAARPPLANTADQVFSRFCATNFCRCTDSKAAAGKKVSLENYTNTQFVFSNASVKKPI
jgi:hypothetical protein